MDLERLVEEAAELPLGNQAALLRVAQLCVDPSATSAGIALEASRDEGLAAQLLRLANSAHSASIRRIGDLPTAISRLGLGLVRSLALATPGLRLLAPRADGLGPARLALHRHAVRTGLVARRVAALSVHPETALTAGLIHNLGLNVLTFCAPGETKMLLNLAAKGVPLAPAEQELFGFTHAALGARLAERWSYPDYLIGAIADHDAAEPRSELAALVQVADLVVRRAGVGVETPGEPRAEVLEAARVEADGLDESVRPLLDAQTRMDMRDASEESAARDSLLDGLDGMLAA